MLTFYILATAVLNVCLGYALAIVLGHGVDPRKLLRAARGEVDFAGGNDAHADESHAIGGDEVGGSSEIT